MHRSFPVKEGYLQAYVHHSFIQQAFLKASYTSGSMLAYAGDPDLTLMGSHFQGAPSLTGGLMGKDSSSQGDWSGDKGERRVVGAQSRVVRVFPEQERRMLSPEK